MGWGKRGGVWRGVGWGGGWETEGAKRERGGRRAGGGGEKEEGVAMERRRRGPLDIGGVGDEVVVRAVLGPAQLEELVPNRQLVGVQQALQAGGRRGTGDGGPAAGVEVIAGDAGDDGVLRTRDVPREICEGACGDEQRARSVHSHFHEIRRRIHRQEWALTIRLLRFSPSSPSAAALEEAW